VKKDLKEPLQRLNSIVIFGSLIIFTPGPDRLLTSGAYGLRDVLTDMSAPARVPLAEDAGPTATVSNENELAR
jgi:hypothetical protein